ncbi:MAG: hypothetical protein AAF563_23880 [Pseudomonadota bacterium]
MMDTQHHTASSRVLEFDGARATKRSDQELAQAAVTAMKNLQDAMDEAIKAGLLIEPNIKRVENRFVNVGVSADSFLLNLHILRQLS